MEKTARASFFSQFTADAGSAVNVCLTILLVVLCTSFAQTATAALVFLKGSDTPIAGFLERQDAAVVVIREELPDGRFKTRELLRADVEDIIITVSKERLQALDPDNPAAYRDYAEELAEKRKDPEARATSLRLYLIAAYLDRESLGRSCVLGMLSLARSPAEQRKYRAMAYLLDPQHDKRILQAPDQPVVDAQETNDDEAKATLITALRAVRRGDTRTVSNLAKRPSFRQSLQRWPGGLTYDQFMALPKQPQDETLARLLRLELSLMRQLRKGNPAGEKPSESWSDIVRDSRNTPVPSLSLKTLTKYDPRKCVFRDDRWVRPGDVAPDGS